MLVAALLKLWWRIRGLRQQKGSPHQLLLVAEFGEKGGTRTYLFSLIPFLQQQAYHVTLLVSSNGIDATMAAWLTQQGVPLLHAPFDFWCVQWHTIPKGLRRRHLLRYQIKELHYWCDLISTHRFGSLLFSVGYPEQYLYSFLLPLPITYVLHTATQQPLDGIKYRVVQYGLRKQQQIITVSHAAQQQLWQHWCKGQPQNGIQAVYNSYTPIPLSPAVGKANPLMVLTIGSLEPYKNPQFFIAVAQQVMAQLPHVQFVWAGDGSLMNSCTQAVAGNNGIRFIGNVDDVVHWYQQATVYFQPSLLESHGIAVVGAMCHALPCVVANHGGLPESVLHQKTGYVVPVQDTAAAVAALLQLLQQPALCMQMGMAGQQRYQQLFTPMQWQAAMQLLIPHV